MRHTVFKSSPTKPTNGGKYVSRTSLCGVDPPRAAPVLPNPLLALLTPCCCYGGERALVSDNDEDGDNEDDGADDDDYDDGDDGDNDDNTAKPSSPLLALLSAHTELLLRWRAGPRLRSKLS